MKKWAGLFIGIGVMGIAVPTFLLGDNQPVLFQSLESKTQDGQNVYNEITFKPGFYQDIWTMRQSHHGSDFPKEKWDQLAIVVDHKQGTATFYQLKEGAEFSQVDTAHAEPLKARCMACHLTGPRAIRPDDESSLSVSLFQKLKVHLWNFRIKLYRQLASQEAVHFSNGSSFTGTEPLLQKPLNLKSCSKCHREAGLRNPLTFQQFGTASFLVEKGFMPPFPFSISDDDRKFIAKISKFINAK